MTEIKVEVVSFGYLHDPPPTADVVLDLRELLHNPAADPTMREKTGVFPEVIEHVLETPGAVDLGEALLFMTRAIIHVRGLAPYPIAASIAIGCSGGRHRSVVLANQLVHWLRQDGLGANVRHRDILKPVVRRKDRERGDRP